MDVFEFNDVVVLDVGNLVPRPERGQIILDCHTANGDALRLFFPPEAAERAVALLRTALDETARTAA